MTTRTAFAQFAALSLALAAAGSAFAQEPALDLPQPVVSVVSRAAVMAERDQARTNVAQRVTETDWPATQFVSQKTRAEVRAETLLAIANGELRALNQEPYSAYVAKAPVAYAPAAVMAAVGK